MSAALLMRLPAARLAHAPRAWLPILAWSALAVVAALVLAHGGGGAGSALEGVFGGYALPLVAYAVLGASLGGDGLARSTRALSAFGASPAHAAASTVIVAALASAVLAGVLGAIVAALAHGPLDPPIARDAATTAWVSALGGAAYAALFAFGASFGKHGGGRAALLMVDWVLGSSTGVAGLFTPRAHLRSLLGGEASNELSGRASAVVLVALGLAFAGAAVRRSRRG